MRDAEDMWCGRYSLTLADYSRENTQVVHAVMLQIWHSLHAPKAIFLPPQFSLLIADHSVPNLFWNVYTVLAVSSET